MLAVSGLRIVLLLNWWATNTSSLHALMCLLILIKIINYFRNFVRASNSLDPDQVRCFIGPVLGQNCLQRISTDASSRQKALE